MGYLKHLTHLLFQAAWRLGRSGEAQTPLKLNKNTYNGAKYFYSKGMENKETEAISERYETVVGNLGHVVTAQNYSKFILEEAGKNELEYRRTMVAGADFNSTDKPVVAIAVYNSIPVHAMPLSVNLLSNALLKHYTR